MIIYEITVTVRDDLVEDYEKYMCQKHIPDLLETGFFIGARISRTSENRYRIQYEAHNQKALDEYLETESSRLREDFLKHFPNGVEVSRENWEVLEVWEN